VDTNPTEGRRVSRVRTAELTHMEYTSGGLVAATIGSVICLRVVDNRLAGCRCGRGEYCAATLEGHLKTCHI